MKAHVSIQPDPDRGREPTYVGSAQRKEVYAHFKSGVIVRSPRTRSRAYPGLRGGAPPTRAFYAELARGVRGGTCLDVGAGAGEGSALLATRADRVVALERDAETLVFAKEFTHDVELIRHDVQTTFPELQAQHAIVADVLGHVQRPLDVLMHLRQATSADARIVIAEPCAVVGQRLSAPLRRAFSAQEMQRLLRRAGLVLERWILERGTFVACWARPARSLWADALVEAAHAEASGQHAAALDAFIRAAESDDEQQKHEAFLGQARNAIALRRGDAAVQSLHAAQATDPECAATYAALAELALLTGDTEGAFGLGIRALEIDSTERSAARVVAHAVERLGHPDAPAAWRTALSLAPDRGDVASEVARVFAERGDYANAVHVLERLRAYGDALGAEFHTTLGWLLLTDGRIADARLEAEVAVQLAPEDDAVAELWGAIRTGSKPPQ